MANILIRRPLRPCIELMKFEHVVAQFEAELRKNGHHIIAGGAGAGAWVFPDGARTRLLNGTFDIDTDSFKMALFQSTSNLGAATTTFAGVTVECNTGGYVAGGIAVVLTLAGTTTVTVDVQTDPTWTVSASALVARFACIYEVAGDVLCYCLLDSTPADVTVQIGNTLTVAASASGVFTLA